MIARDSEVLSSQSYGLVPADGEAKVHRRAYVYLARFVSAWYP